MTERKPSIDLVEEAKRVPNGWVYEILGVYGLKDAVPPEAIKGAWPVDADGVIRGEFVPNPRFASS